MENTIKVQRSSSLEAEGRKTLEAVRKLKYFDMLYEGHIAGIFTIFKKNRLYKLQNGTWWIQESPTYTPCGSGKPVESPRAQLSCCRGTYTLSVGLDLADMRRVYPISESQLEGPFAGWCKGQIYTLKNGEVWQALGNRRLKQGCCDPVVSVFEDRGKVVMEIDGFRAPVECILRR